jgi:hypothetical protein
LLAYAGRLRCVSSRGKVNPRMVKRRHSPYPSHVRDQPLNQSANFSPHLLEPLPLSTYHKFYVLS